MSKSKVLKEAKILYKEKNLTFNQTLSYVYDLAHRSGHIKGAIYYLKSFNHIQKQKNKKI